MTRKFLACNWALSSIVFPNELRVLMQECFAAIDCWYGVIHYNSTPAGTLHHGYIAEFKFLSCFEDVTELNLCMCEYVVNEEYAHGVVVTMGGMPIRMPFQEGGSFFPNLQSFSAPSLRALECNLFQGTTKLEELRLPKCEYFATTLHAPLLHTVYMPSCIVFGLFSCSGEDKIFAPKLKTLYMPKCERMGSCVFEGATELTEIHLPSLCKLSWGSFSRCDNLRVVDAPMLIDTGHGCFAQCNKIERMITRM